METDETTFELTGPPPNGARTITRPDGKPWGGPLLTFVAEHFDPAVITAHDAKRLLPEAQAAGIKTTFGSIANTLMRVKRTLGLPTNPLARGHGNQYTATKRHATAAAKTRRGQRKYRMAGDNARALKEFLAANRDRDESDRGNALRLLPALAREFPGIQITPKSVEAHVRRLRMTGGRVTRKKTKARGAQHWSQTAKGKARLQEIREARENGERPLGGRVAKEEVITLAREGAQVRLAFHEREAEKLRLFLGGHA